MPIFHETHNLDGSAKVIQTWWRKRGGKTPQSWEDIAEKEVVEDIEDVEDVCPICLSHIDDSHDACVTECKHKFHLKCILQSSAKSWGESRCPLCRNELLSQDNVHDEPPTPDESDFLELPGQELFAEDIDLYFSADLSEETLLGEHIPVLPDEGNDNEPDWISAWPLMTESEMTQHQIHVCSELMRDAFERARTIQETTQRIELEETAVREQLMFDNGFREGRSRANDELRSLREQLNTAQAEIIRLLKEKIDVDEKKKGKSKL